MGNLDTENESPELQGNILRFFKANINFTKKW